MAKIDVSQWGEFKVGDLFDWFHGRRRNRNELELSSFDIKDDSVAYITAGFESQGIIGEVGLNYLANNQLETYTNAITIDMFGNCFFHNYKIAGDDNVYFLINNERSINQMLFVSAVINSVTSSKFGYKNQFRQHNLLELQIKLPITSDGKPDWEYMDNYIAELAARAHQDVNSLNKVEPKRHQINIGSWKEFKVGDLLNFDSSKQIYHAENLDILDKPADNSYHPYVVRSGFNNGIRGYINENPNTLNPGNTISFAQDTAQLFYQAEPYFTGNKIKICSLKDEQELTKPISLFLIASLLKSFSMFSWDSSFNVTTLKRVKIKLPITSDGKPNWDYMDNYVTNLTTRTFRDVNSLRMLTGM